MIQSGPCVAIYVNGSDQWKSKKKQLKLGQKQANDPISFTLEDRSVFNGRILISY